MTGEHQSDLARAKASWEQDWPLDVAAWTPPLHAHGYADVALNEGGNLKCFVQRQSAELGNGARLLVLDTQSGDTLTVDASEGPDKTVKINDPKGILGRADDRDMAQHVLTRNAHAADAEHRQSQEPVGSHTRKLLAAAKNVAGHILGR